MEKTETACMDKAMQHESAPPTVPGKGVKMPGNLGAEITLDKKTKAEKEADFVALGKSNTTPGGEKATGDVRVKSNVPVMPTKPEPKVPVKLPISNTLSNGKAHPSFAKKTSGMQRKGGEFNPQQILMNKTASAMQRHGEFNPQRRD